MHRPNNDVVVVVVFVHVFFLKRQREKWQFLEFSVR